MDKRKLMLLLGALVVAIGTALAARSMLGGGAAPQAEAAQQVAQGPKVLVAQRALPVGTIITQDALSFQAWPKEMVKDAYFLEGEADMNKLLGTVVRYPITAGQPLTQGALVRPGQRGFLAAALGPGMRAVTVGVSATSGVAGFVFPGDRVDLVLTQEVTGGGDGPPLRASETIVRNIRVLAVDQSLNARDEAGNQVAHTSATVTFEATPKIAEKIAVAQTIGQLSLSLRSLADNNAELEHAIAAGEVTVPHSNDPRAERQMLLAIASQPIDTNTTYTVGADVSRFQRATVPGRGRGEGNSNSAPVAVAPRVASSEPIGPVVRVARGNNVTLVPVGAR